MSEAISSSWGLARRSEQITGRGISHRTSELVEEYAGVLRVLGAIAGFKYFRNKRNHLDYPIQGLKHPLLKHPINITSALCDILNANEILNHRAYTLHHPKQEVDGLPIIDIGAFIGISAVYFASTYPNSTVHAIEPLARNYELLMPNAAAYRGRIITTRAAVLAGNGNASVVGSDRRHPYMPLFASSRVSIEGDNQTVRSIQPASLLDTVGPAIGILKVDIEGGETELFGSGSMDPLLDITRILMIETHDQFAPGATKAVDQAATASGLTLTSENPHAIRVYTRA
ncbi:MAG: FkbM family methyltransferase [Candidatus Saccharimonadales bacterium]